jgi:hypothetical protein
MQVPRAQTWMSATPHRCVLLNFAVNIDNTWALDFTTSNEGLFELALFLLLRDRFFRDAKRGNRWDDNDGDDWGDRDGDAGATWIQTHKLERWC